MSKLTIEQQVRVIGALTEGCSIRATERLTDIHRDTVMRLGVSVGEGCDRLHRERMRNLDVNLVELDEQWAFIAKKQKRVKDTDPAEMGDVWLFVALAANQKAVLSYVVGKRTAENAETLAIDLESRITTRAQLTSDGFAPYIGAVNTAFGANVDFAQLVKIYQATPGNDAAHRYSPGSIRGLEKNVIRGNPDEGKISTSYVERFNLTTRMAMRRFTRLTNGFSKKLENHRAAIALHIAHYNFCRVHETLRCTPTMQLGVTNHIWTIDELLDRALATLPETPAPIPPPTTQVPATVARHAMQPFTLRVIRGGKLR